jgi:uncharacterized protein
MVSSAERKKDNWLSKLFEPHVNFYALLQNQSQTTLEGMLALEDFMAEGEPQFAQKVRELERHADEQKLLLERKLTDSFVTPFDREDIYDISVYMDEIINSAKATVREVEAMDISPKQTQFKEMASTLIEGTRCINNCFKHLNKNLKQATEEAQLARKSENRFNKNYRAAMKQLLLQDDFKLIFKTTEVYRSMKTGSEKIDRLGEKLLHVIVKMT